MRVLTLALLIATTEVFAAGVIIEWTPVNQDVAGNRIEPGSLLYRLYGKGADQDQQAWDRFHETPDTSFSVPSVPDGCYDVYVTAFDVTTGLESDRSNVESICLGVTFGNPKSPEILRIEVI